MDILNKYTSQTASRSMCVAGNGPDPARGDPDPAHSIGKTQLKID